MNVVIVTPGHPSPRGKSFPPALTAPYLAALATPHVDHIDIIDLAVQPFDLYSPAPDVAMFTSTMAQSDHIFKIARYLKANGSKIFLGGPYVSLAYDFDPRIAEIADCVVLGEGEKALPQALKDLKSGNLQHRYSMPINTLAGIPFSRLDLLDHKKYFSSSVVIGTRGCVHKCGYCSIGDIYGQKYLKRPVDEVIAEIKFQTSRSGINWLDRKFVQFWDDNPAGDLNWFHNLLEKMIPLNKWWISQICLNVADNEKTVKLMKASGCKGVFVGIESVSAETLQGQNKETINVVNDYIRQCRTLIENGLVVVGAIMFGFDSDTKDILFKKTLKVLEKMGITMLNNLVFTPYPHLEFFRTLVKEDRLITKEAKYYNGYTVVHKPKNIHPADLQEAVINMHKKFYSPRSMFKRMIKHNILKYPEFLIWNKLWGTNNYDVIPGVNINQWLKYLRTL